MRKGISPVIATLALIIIGVAGGILALKFVDPFATRLATGATGNNILTIEGVKLEGNVATIALTNVGTKPVRIIAVLLLDNSMNLLEKVDVDQTVSPGASTTFTVTFSSVTAGQKYGIKIVADDGSSATVASVRARGSSKWLVTWYRVSGSAGDPTFSPEIGNEEWGTLNFEYNWGTGVVYGGRSDYVGYEATAVVYFTSTTADITTVSDDGMRVYVDGVLMNDNWGVHGRRTVHTTHPITPGYHTVVIQWYEWGGYAYSKVQFVNAEFRP